MKTRTQLEHLEQTNPAEFMAEVEAFASGQRVLVEDNYEEIVEQMYDDADKIEATFNPGLPKHKIAIRHAATCLLMFAFGVFFSLCWLLDEKEIADVSLNFWGLK
jgi:hypothetical protein